MNSKDYRNIREAYLNVYEQEEVLDEITGGKGHPGYKAGSRDLGPMQSGHPADSSKRTMKGGTMSMRHGDHLGDLDDNDDDDDDGLEAGLKDSAKKSRENVRKPLRNMVKTAAKRLNKESYDLYDLILSHLIDEGYDLSDYTQLDEISDKLATAARNLRQKRYTKSADQARNLQLSKGNRADMFYKNFDKTVKLNDTLKSRKKRTGTEIPRVEQLDLYDIILSHLIDEGYADTEEAAERIMVNMSEDWRESIVEQGLDPDAPGNTHSLADLHNALKKYEDKKNAAKSPKPGGSGSAGKVKENNK